MRRIVSGCLLLAFASAALAGEPVAQASPPDVRTPVVPPPDLVVTATRTPTPIREIPAGVTVIDRNAIEEHGYRSLAEALAGVPGLRVSQSGGAGGNASVFMRGLNSNHVLVLRDGMPLNDAADSSGAYNFGVDTLSDIERIEVVRGPMAAVYGSGAIAGVINLISRRGTKQGMHAEAEIAGGYPAQVAGSAVISGIEGKVDYAGVASSSSQRGFDAVPTRMSVHTGVPQGFRDRVASLNLGYTPVEGTRLSLFLRARRAVFGFNNLGGFDTSFNPLPTYDNANATGRADALLGRIGVTSKLFSGSYETGLFVGRLQEDRHYAQTLDPRDPNLASVDNRYHGYRTDAQWNNTLHLNDFFESRVLSATDLTFGYEYIGDAANIKTQSGSVGGSFAQNAAAHVDSNAGYAGLQTTLLDRLTVTGQVRQDAVLNQTPFTWRLGGVLEVAEIGTHFKASYGTAFRAPSLFDRYGIDSFGYVGNPLLRPERSEGWEAGFTTDALAVNGRDLVSFGATWFSTRVRDLIALAFAPVYTSINTGSARFQGVETEFTLRPMDWLTVSAVYTYTEAQNADTGTRLLRRPQNTWSLNAVARPIAHLTIFPELLFTGAFQDFRYDNNSFGTGTGTSGQGLIVNLSVSYDVRPDITLFAYGRNLANSRFEPVNGYQTPGTSFLAGTRMRF